MRLIMIFLLLLVFPFEQSHACGPDTDCVIGDRIYRIRLPENHDAKRAIGAIVFAHGYRGTAKGVMRNRRLGQLAGSLDLALVALKSKGADWKIPGTPSDPSIDGSVEFDYVDNVLKDIQERFNIDLQNTMATGFSAGGMMVWNLACHRSASFKGFAPIAGTFWQPEPSTCTSPPAHVIHIHGDSDPTVPLMGRPIGPTHQGRVPQVLDMYADYGNYQPTAPYQTEKLECETSQNPSGKILQFCLFKGGHSFSVRYVEHAWKQISQADQNQ